MAPRIIGTGIVLVRHAIPVAVFVAPVWNPVMVLVIPAMFVTVWYAIAVAVAPIARYPARLLHEPAPIAFYPFRLHVHVPWPLGDPESANPFIALATPIPVARLPDIAVTCARHA